MHTAVASSEPQVGGRPSAESDAVLADALAAVAPADANPPAAAASKMPPGTIEVCGYGPVSREALAAVEEGQPPAWMQAVDAKYEAERQALLKRLAGGSTRQRVAAALLGDDVQAAAQIAVGTDDPIAYQIALMACRRDEAYRQVVARQRAWLKTPAASGVAQSELREPGPQPSNCAALGVERLEAMAPGETLPALMRLTDAMDRSDEAGVSQALYQIAQRSRQRLKARALSAAVADAVGDEPAPGETMALSSAVSQDMMSSTTDSLGSLYRVCRNESLRDANRRQLCEQVVRQMGGQASEVLEASALYTLETRLGLPHGPLSLPREESQRLMQAMGEQSERWLSAPSCANLSGAGKQVIGLARQGELAYLRAQVRKAPASASAPR